METPFSRTELLLGDAAMQRLRQCHVAIFGIGGVGGHAMEALARCGIGTLTLVDHDTVSLSNINRQIIALHSTVGMRKVDVAAARIADISPQTAVIRRPEFFSAENMHTFCFSDYDYVIDAIDSVPSKVELIVQARAAGTPIISAMGAGNKLDGGAFAIADLPKTQMCPLARVMRRELRLRGIRHLKVVYSKEPPRAPLKNGAADGQRRVPGSVSFVPAVAGLMLGGEVVRELCGISRDLPNQTIQNGEA